jgi:tetratricopeptide (TPR) repeat protein
MYRPNWIDKAFVQDWSFGMNVQNLFAPQIKVGDEIDEFPLTAKFGLMKKIHLAGTGTINVLFDLDHSQNRDLKFHFGSEYDFRDMGKVRLGYNGSALAFGAGAKYNIFEIDYGYGSSEFSEFFAATHRISVTVNFGLTRNDMFEIAELRRIEEENRIKREIREADKQDFIAEHLEAADKFFNENKYLDAIVEYQQVIGVEPFHFRAGVMLDSSNALLQQEFDLRQSLAVKDALDKDRAESDSIFVQNHFEKGRALLDQKQFVEAMIEFNIALERDPQNQILQNSIATTQRRIIQEVNSLIEKSRQEFQNQNYSEALRLLGDARLLGGTDAQMQNEVETLAARINLQENIQKGLLLYDVGNYTEALKVLEEALRLDPDNNLVKQYLERSRMETLTTQEEMEPDMEKKYLQGVNMFLSGKYADAIQIWEEILVIHPYNKRVLESISNARERLKNRANQ